MSFEWPVDKLTVINRALLLTGNNPCAVADDGSDEWNVASPAYETALATMIETHTWGFSTVVNANLPASPTAPANTMWDTQYPLPADLVHLIWVKLNQNIGDTPSSTTAMPTLYDIEGGMLVVNAAGGPPPNPSNTPGIVSIKYVSANVSDPTAATPTFVHALIYATMAGIYRGLHEDTVEADKTDQKAIMLMQMARTRYDQQKPKRAMWNSRITAARRVRRPWPQLGINAWSGSNTPG